MDGGKIRNDLDAAFPTEFADAFGDAGRVADEDVDIGEIIEAQRIIAEARDLDCSGIIGRETGAARRKPREL